jgi:glycosyltransferase involved in cell wall biosynthesis
MNKSVFIHLLPKPKNRIQRILNTSRKVFKIATSLKGDIYHFHDPEGLVYALYWQFRTKKPFIYDVHECYPEDILIKKWIPSFLSKFISFIFDKFELFSTKKLKGVVAATDYISLRFKFHPKLSIIHNYPLLDEFRVNPLDIKKKNNGHFLYAGGISELRGINTMIKAISLTNSRSYLDLAGNFFNTNEFNNFKLNNDNKNNILYHGLLTRLQLKNLMNTSIAGLVLFHPDKSHINSLPNKIFEYMSASLPVIASNFTLWSNIIRKYNCGLVVDPLSPNEIAESMLYLINNPETAILMGKNGRSAIENQFNWENEYNKLINLYINLLN